MVRLVSRCAAGLRSGPNAGVRPIGAPAKIALHANLRKGGWPSIAELHPQFLGGERSRNCFERERREGRTVLFPIRLDPECYRDVIETAEAWAADIRRTCHIGDFTAWEEHGRYMKAPERLLRDLKTSDRYNRGAVHVSMSPVRNVSTTVTAAESPAEADGWSANDKPLAFSVEPVWDELKTVNVGVRNANSQVARARSIDDTREAGLRGVIAAGEAKAEELRNAVAREERLRFDDSMVRHHLGNFDDVWQQTMTIEGQCRLLPQLIERVGYDARGDKVKVTLIGRKLRSPFQGRADGRHRCG
jgi:hypothetical protein